MIEGIFLNTDNQVYKYQIVSRWQTTLDEKRYLSYGICVLQNTGGSENTVSVIWDISDQKPFVSDLVKSCNRLQLEPIHFMNVVEDALLSQKNEY